jgi:hypothetical protein
MLESAFRHPFSCSTSFTSTAASGPQAEACTREDACVEEADQLFEDILVTLGNNDKWDEAEWCILTMLWADETIAGIPSRWVLHPDAELMAGDEEAAEHWDWQFTRGVYDGFVMGREAVARAVAQWEGSRNKGQARASEWDTPEAKQLTRVVRAAAREGDGVIVHPGCLLGHRNAPLLYPAGEEQELPLQISWKTLA